MENGRGVRKLKGDENRQRWSAGGLFHGRFAQMKTDYATRGGLLRGRITQIHGSEKTHGRRKF